MLNCFQQLLKEAFGAIKSTTAENDNPSGDSELQLSGSDSDITDPDVDHSQGEEPEDIIDQPSGA